MFADQLSKKIKEKWPKEKLFSLEKKKNKKKLADTVLTL